MAGVFDEALAFRLDPDQAEVWLYQSRCSLSCSSQTRASYELLWRCVLQQADAVLARHDATTQPDAMACELREVVIVAALLRGPAQRPSHRLRPQSYG